MVSWRLYPFYWVPMVLTAYSAMGKDYAALGMSYHLQCLQMCPGTSCPRIGSSVRSREMERRVTLVFDGEPHDLPVMGRLIGSG